MQLATIGYESATLDAVIAKLQEAGVEIVIDVRAVAASRRAGFSKTILRTSLEAAGIGYEHLRGLGTPKPGREAARKGRIGEMEAIFSDHMETPEAQDALARAIAIAGEQRAALLCYEADACGCHRRIVADRIKDALGVGIVNLQRCPPNKREETTMIHHPANSRPTRRPPAEYFTGDVQMDPIIEAPDPARIRAIRVSFAPGARTAWHTHPLGQTLHIVSGVGRFQTEGEAIVEMLPGDTIWIPPGERHWHGAAADTGMVHIALQEAENGVSVTWERHVTDAEYLGET